jgi:glycosyltransferase involved in cell wall biosynthesis
MQLARQTFDSSPRRAAAPAPRPDDTAALPAGRLDALFVLNSLTVGGSERKAVRVANALAARGLRTGLAYLNGPETLLSALDAPVARWCLGRTGRFSPAAVVKLKQLMSAHQPGVVFAMNLYPTLYMVAAARLLGRARPRTVALINTCANARGFPAWRRGLYKRVLQRADLTIHGCQAYRQTWAPGAGRMQDRTRVIYNGVDTAEFDPAALGATPAQCRARFGIPEDRFVIGTVGRLVAGKNHGVLLETAQRLHFSGCNVHVLLAGEGPQQAQLAASAEELALRSRVTFTGVLADVRPALQAMDVFVLPSLDVETFSNAALEAMAMARPVILTEVGGAREMLEGTGGYVLRPQELKARLPALLKQLHADADRRTRLGAAARTRTQTHFSFESMIERYLSLIQDDIP